MSDELTQARAAWARGLRVAGMQTFPATVVSVDATTRTCAVESEYGRYADVLLYGVVDGKKKGLCVLPAKDSMVLVGRIGGSDDLYVAMTSEVDRVLFTTGDTLFMMDENGYVVNRGPYGLLDTLTRLCEAILALRVPTNTGASGTPINFADFMKIKDDLTKYLGKNAE